MLALTTRMIIGQSLRREACDSSGVLTFFELEVPGIMKKTPLFSLALNLLFVANIAAQSLTPFNYSAYNPVTTGTFANFTYPAHPLFYGAGNTDKRKSFTLKKGIFHPKFDEGGYIVRLGAYLKSVDFADVTSDGHKEAIVVIGNLCDCSGVWFGIYIYDMAGQKPRQLLWSFQTGDRAVGGLRRIYGRHGNLIIELYGIGSAPWSPPKNYEGAWCCTKDYTQRRYKWNGRRFVQQGKARVLVES